MKHEMWSWTRSSLAALGLLTAVTPSQAGAQPAGTAFTYQGRLADSGAPANGPYDFQLILYTAAVGGSQVGPVVTLDDIAVVDGLFTVILDFGPSAFDGDARFLEIGVRPGSSTGGYTLLGARQELTPAPHSLFSQGTPWTGVSGKPPGFDDDVDNDVLGGLSCANGELAKWNGSAWACDTDLDTTYTAGAGLDLTGSTFSVADLGVTTAKLADSAVTSAKVQDAAIATADLANNAGTSPKIADGTIALADLGQNGCTGSQILKWNGSAWACAADTDTTYTAGAGLDLTGSTFSVADLGVTTAKLADNAVTSAKVQDASIATADLANNSVTSPKIADGTIALADLGQNGCTADQIMKWNGAAWACVADTDTTYTAGAGLDLTGTTFSVANLGVTTVKLADSAVTSAKVQDASIGTADLANNSVTSAKIADGTIALADLGQNGCAGNQILKWNGAAWGCAADADTDTTYTAGTGLTLAGTQFAINSALVARKDSAAGNQLFDGGTLSLDYANNRVGVGFTAPTVPLDVNGTARAFSFALASAQNGKLYVPGSALVPEPGDPWATTTDGAGYILPGGLGAVAVLSSAMDLPQGATVTSLTCDYYDNDPGTAQLTVELRRRAYSSITASVMANLSVGSTANGGGIQTVTDSTITGSSIDHLSNAYFIRLAWVTPATSSINLRLYGCGVTYTYTTLVD